MAYVKKLIHASLCTETGVDEALVPCFSVTSQSTQA